MKLHLSIFALVAAATFANGQTGSGLVCTSTAIPPLVHAEGVSERVGDIVLTCAGGTPSSTVTTNLSVFLNTNITNKLNANNAADVALSVGSGANAVVSNVPAQLAAPNMISFNGLEIPVAPDGTAVIRISNLRGDATRLPVSFFPVAITANVSANAGLSLTTPTFSVGVPTLSLFATSLQSLQCSQLGSPLPSSMTLADFRAAGSSASTTRITEGFATAFMPREPMADNGTRIISRYSGFPAGARIFVPDVIAGSTADLPTSIGDFGQAGSGGQYTPGKHQLLMVRVAGADANGAGGTLTYTPGAAGSTAATFSSMGEITMTNGNGQAVYEVVDADPSVTEWAQIPSFLGLPATGVAQDIKTTQTILLGPVSAVNTASATAPVPRFSGGVSGTDCSLNGDCDASYLPKLAVYPEPLTYTFVQNGPIQARYVRIINQGSGVLSWNVSVQYKSGNNWLFVYPTSGSRNATIRVDAHAVGVPPGTYEATLIVDAGIGGRQTFPITMTISPAPEQPTTDTKKPAVTNVIHAATYADSAFVRGSLGTIKGSFAGKDRSVTFDGIAAPILYQDDHQINLQVPPALAIAPTAQMVVTVDGVSTPAQTVKLADAAPGIFNRGILNQDYSVNDASNPAAAGSVIQVYATGLLPPEGGTVEAQIGDRAITTIDYAGAAPGLRGVQQVNVRIPADAAAGTVDLVLCNTTNGQRVCSPAAKLSIRQ